MEFFDYSKHYIKIDSDNNIVDGFSSAFRIPQEGDILLTAEGDREFSLLDEVNPLIKAMNGTTFYKYENGKVIKK